MQRWLAAHAALDRTAPDVEGPGDLAAAPASELRWVAETIGDRFSLGFRRLHGATRPSQVHCARRENSVK